MDSGFAGGEDETYNVYDQPFRSGRDMASNIYRPSKNIDKDAYADDLDSLMHNNRSEDFFFSFFLQTALFDLFTFLTVLGRKWLQKCSFKINIMCWQHIQEISQNLEWPKEGLNTINQEHLGLTLLYSYSHYEVISEICLICLKG